MRACLTLTQRRANLKPKPKFSYNPSIEPLKIVFSDLSQLVEKSLTNTVHFIGNLD